MTPSTTTPPAPFEVIAPDTLTELRTRTRELHTRAERHPVQAALVRGQSTGEAYASYLRQMAHLHDALERELLTRLGQPMLAPVSQAQFRAGAALVDIESLGIIEDSGPVASIAAFAGSVGQRSTPELLGMQYVLEGSTNGGRYIAAAVRRSLGLEERVATTYLDPHGDAQRERWGEFCHTLSELSLERAEREQVITGAEAMFELMISIFDEMSDPAGTPGRAS